MATMMQAEALTEYAWRVRGFLMWLSEEIKDEEYFQDKELLCNLIWKYQTTKANALNLEDEIKILNAIKLKYATIENSKDKQKVFSFTEKNLKETIKEILQDNNYSKSTTQSDPQAFVLGGLPGSGKSSYIKQLAGTYNGFVICGDDYRELHPRFREIASKHLDNWVSKTTDFAAAVIRKLLEKGIQERKNIIIEGTFRTFTAPASTLKQFKDAGYQTNVHLVLCHPHVARTSTINRFREMQKIDPLGIGRPVSSESFQETVKNFAQNADKIKSSGLADYFVMVARRELDQYIKVYDEQSKAKPSKVIEYEKTRKLSTKEEETINNIIKEEFAIEELTKAKSKDQGLER